MTRVYDNEIVMVGNLRKAMPVMGMLILFAIGIIAMGIWLIQGTAMSWTFIVSGGIIIISAVGGIRAWMVLNVVVNSEGLRGRTVRGEVSFGWHDVSRIEIKTDSRTGDRILAIYTNHPDGRVAATLGAQPEILQVLAMFHPIDERIAEIMKELSAPPLPVEPAQSPPLFQHLHRQRRRSRIWLWGAIIFFVLAALMAIALVEPSEDRVTLAIFGGLCFGAGLILLRIYKKPLQ